MHFAFKISWWLVKQQLFDALPRPNHKLASKLSPIFRQLSLLLPIFQLSPTFQLSPIFQRLPILRLIFQLWTSSLLPWSLISKRQPAFIPLWPLKLSSRQRWESALLSPQFFPQVPLWVPKLPLSSQPQSESKWPALQKLAHLLTPRLSYRHRQSSPLRPLWFLRIPSIFPWGFQRTLLFRLSYQRKRSSISPLALQARFSLLIYLVIISW